MWTESVYRLIEVASMRIESVYRRSVFGKKLQRVRSLTAREDVRQKNLVDKLAPTRRLLGD